MNAYRLTIASLCIFISTLLVNISLLGAQEAPPLKGPPTSKSPPTAIPDTLLPEKSPYTPPMPRPMPREYEMVPDLHDIFFDWDSSKIRKDMRAVLDKNAEWLKKNENYLIVVEGNADETGFNEYNLYLSERRAKTVRDYLVAVGVDSVRIVAIGYGEERPTAFEHNENAWKQNRRASFLIKVWR